MAVAYSGAVAVSGRWRIVATLDARLDAVQEAVDGSETLQVRSSAELGPVLPSILDRAFNEGQ
jgi:hypothetical protein